MGIDISCTECDFQDKQCFSSRRQLLDALREYLRVNAKTKELKYINWFYRHDSDDKNRVLNISETEKDEAKKLLQEQKLDGFFCWIFLPQDDYILTPFAAGKFKETYTIVKSYIKGRFLDINILVHAYSKKHNLRTW